MSSKILNIIATLPRVAIRSLNVHQHGAVLIKNGRPVSYGFNSVQGDKFRHAEVDAIDRYLRSHNVNGYYEKEPYSIQEGPPTYAWHMPYSYPMA